MEQQQKDAEALRRKEAENKKAEDKDKAGDKKAPQPAAKKRVPAKKEPKKEDLGTARSPALDPIAYVLEFRAYRFDVNSLPTAAQQKQCSEQIQAESSEEVYELWESFNQFFSMKECAHALQLAEGDLGRAAQWLVSHGLQERQCPTLLPEDCTVIAQVELDPKKLSPELLSGDASALLKAAMAQKEQPPPPSSYGGYYLQQQQQPSKAPGYSLGMGGWKQPQRAESGRDIKSSLANLLKELVAKGLIEYVAFPAGLAEKYQSFTQADLGRLRAAGYTREFKTVEQGVAAYVAALQKK